MSEALEPETWLEEHGDVLYGYAMLRVSDADTAEELVQETLLTALERQATFEGRSTVRTWLVGILRFKILQHYRAQGRADASLECGPEVVDRQFNRFGKWKRLPEPWASDPGAVPEAEEFRGVLTECLFKLPPRAAEAFLLSEQQSLDGERLGRVLEVPASHVYVVLHRARAALRRCLETNWFRDGGGAGG